MPGKKRTYIPVARDGRCAPPKIPGAECAGAVAASRLLSSLTDACLIADCRGRILFANNAARELFHFQGRALGRRTSPLLSDRRALSVIEDAVQKNKPRSAVVPLTLSGEGPPGAELAPASSPAAETVQSLADPLSIIKGYLENLLNGDIKDPAALRQSVRAMQRQTLRIEGMLKAFPR